LGTLLALAFIAELRHRTTNPAVDDILNALTPWLYKAIIAGEHAALRGMEETDAVLQNMDKAKVANSLYDLLPAVIVLPNGLPLPVGRLKVLVPRETFASWVKDAYDDTHAFILANETYLRSQVDALTHSNEAK
jgi:hypothetical protein